MTDFFLPDYVKTALSCLEGGGFKAFIVGGCVRDMLLGLTPHDYDITTSALPEQTEAVFSAYKTIETGIKHGTVTVLIDNFPIEITTMRFDGDYSDNRRPDSVIFTDDIAADLSRRDFTMNAIAYNPVTGTVDPFSGAEDINRGIIRAVGDPSRRFNEDGLRIIRALRFASVFGFKIEKETAAALHKCKNFLGGIAEERVYVELSKLICGNPSPVFGEFYDVIGVIIPELLVTVGFQQNSKYHCFNVFEHILGVLTATPPVLTIRFAALFHDIGKPACYTEENGVGHFKGHAAVSADIAERVLRRLRADKRTLEETVLLVRYHDYPLEPDDARIRRVLRKFGEDTTRKILEIHIADDSAKMPEYRGRIAGYREILARIDAIVAEGECFSLKSLAVGGDDLLKLGYSGIEIGRALDFLFDAVVDGKCENDKNLLINYLANYANI